jgi:imidazole glycerol-phosphate synthase subunit HisH
VITIIDYGVGNVLAFVNMYDRMNIPTVIAKSVDDLENARKIILPGVGSFDHAMTQFIQSGMLEPISHLVLQKEVPILGICVGMQMLAKKSEEGKLPGLGWIDGQVKKMEMSILSPSLKLPHMGWNNVMPIKGDPLFDRLNDESVFYFLHSYFFKCNSNSNILATTEYGNSFPCAVSHNHIYGVQFHPEKSHNFGSKLLKNFADL